MSGGSFNYLCFADDLAAITSRRPDLEAMHGALLTLEGGEAAADATARLIRMLDVAESHLRASGDLREVWHAVEWWTSGDSSKDDARAAARAYTDSLGEFAGGR